MSFRIGFIGAGNMARALAGGLLTQGWPRASLVLSDPNADQRALATRHFGVKTTDDNAAVVAHAEVLVLAVKPQTMRTVCQALAPAVSAARPLVVSIAAGIPLAALARWLGDERAIVRAMPNTPALIGAGITGMCANARCSASARERAHTLLSAVGPALWVADDAGIDVVTAVSGSGPAYFFRAIEALMAAGEAQGLNAEDAQLLAIHTAFGAAKMALEAKASPAELRAQVTSPGGTTEKALRSLAADDIDAVFARAVAAARARAAELAREVGGQ